MRHFYATLFVAGLFGLYISAGAAEVQPLLPCAFSGVICTVSAGIGIRGFNRTERRERKVNEKVRNQAADARGARVCRKEP